MRVNGYDLITESILKELPKIAIEFITEILKTIDRNHENLQKMHHDTVLVLHIK